MIYILLWQKYNRTCGSSQGADNPCRTTEERVSGGISSICTEGHTSLPVVLVSSLEVSGSARAGQQLAASLRLSGVQPTQPRTHRITIRIDMFVRAFFCSARYGYLNSVRTVAVEK